MNHYIVIEGERYFFPDDGGIDAVRDEVLNAVRAGGAYVSLGRDGVGYIEVLVTATTAVSIEHVIVVDVPPTADTDEVGGDDPGWWI